MCCPRLLKVIFVTYEFPYHLQVKSEAKAVHVHKYKSVQRPQAVNNRFLAPQAQGPVGLALDVSWKPSRI